MSPSLLIARGISRVHLVHGSPVSALAPVDLEVCSGDVVVVTGPSGSGKSTLMALLAGWDRPSAGDLQRPPARGLTVLVPPRVPLVDTLTVRDNIAIGGAITEIVSALAVDHLLDRMPTEVSMGERQRIGIARALAARPALLLLDEPTAHQDATHARLVLDALTSPAEGSAVVLTTHDADVLSVATKVLTLDHHSASRYG